MKIAAIALAGILVAHISSAQPLFEAPFYSYPAGSGGRALCVADFDEDGARDVAEVLPSDDSPDRKARIVLYLATGARTFRRSRSIPVDRNAVALEGGNLVGDDHADLAVLCAVGSDPILDPFAVEAEPDSAPALVLFRGLGGGEFAPPVSTLLDIEPAEMLFGDFNGDGRPDVAAGNRWRGSVQILLAGPGAQFRPTPPIQPGDRFWGWEAGDVDGDGIDDLTLLASWPGPQNGRLVVALIPGDREERFVCREMPGVPPMGEAVLMARDHEAGTTWFFSFGEAPQSALPCRDFEVAFSMTAYALRRGGRFQLVDSLPIAGWPRWVRVADVAGGPEPEILLQAGQSMETGPTTLLSCGIEQSGAIRKLSESCLGRSWLEAAIQDLDGDGREDLVQPDGVGFLVAYGGGDGIFRKAVADTSVRLIEDARVLDADADGDSDLLLRTAGADMLPDTMRLLLGDGRGRFVESWKSSLGSLRGVLRELPGNGNPRARRFALVDDGGLTVLDVDARGMREESRLPADSVSLLGSTGDWNGDGRLDAADVGDKALRIRIQDEGGKLQTRQTVALRSHVFDLARGDFDGDGCEDLIAFAREDSLSLELLGDGTGRFVPAWNVPFAAWRGIALAVDLESDGRSELAVVRGGRIEVLLRDPDAGWTVTTSLPAGTDIGSLAAADVNADGMPDLLAVATGDCCCDPGTHTVEVFLGEPGGRLREGIGYGLPFKAAQVLVEDVTGDGILDLIGVADEGLAVLRGAGAR